MRGYAFCLATGDDWKPRTRKLGFIKTQAVFDMPPQFDALFVVSATGAKDGVVKARMPMFICDEVLRETSGLPVQCGGMFGSHPPACLESLP